MELLACIFKSEDKSQFSIVKEKKKKGSFQKTMENYSTTTKNLIQDFNVSKQKTDYFQAFVLAIKERRDRMQNSQKYSKGN